MAELQAEGAETLIYLLRHGATASNLENPPRLQGQGVDRELSPLGQVQSAKAAALLSSLPIGAVYASSLARSRQTAAAIAAAHGQDVRVLAGLVEVDVGRWEGKNWREILEEDRHAHEQYRRDPAVFGYPDGENLTQVQARMQTAMGSIVAKHAGRSVVVVGHGMANRALLAPLLGIPLAQASRLTQDNGAINVLRITRAEWRVVCVNSTFHLR